MKNLLVAILFSILLTSCKKYGHGKIDGIVYEKGSGIPLKGAKVYLYSNHNDGIDRPSREKLDSTISDGNGYYRFYLWKKPLRRYWVWCTHENYMLSEPSWKDTYVEVKTKTTQNLYLCANAYLIVKVKKSSIGQNKSIHIETERPFTVSIFVQGNNQIDTILPKIYPLHGDSPNYFVWNIYTPSTSGNVTNRDTIYVSRHDTITKTFVID